MKKRTGRSKSSRFLTWIVETLKDIEFEFVLGAKSQVWELQAVEVNARDE